MIRDIDLTENLSAALLRTLAGVRDLTAPMTEIAAEWLINTRDRFRAEKGPDGLPWAKSRRAIEEGGSTLFEQGFLFGAIRPDSGADFAAVGVEETGPAAVYARIHQEGGTITPGAGKRALSTPFGFFRSVRIPARPYIGAADEDVEMAEQVLTGHLQSLLDSGSAPA